MNSVESAALLVVAAYLMSNRALALFDAGRPGFAWFLGMCVMLIHGIALSLALSVIIPALA